VQTAIVLPPVLGLRASVAAVWVYEGLWCKILGRVPSQLDVVTAVPRLGARVAKAFLNVLGFSEVALAVWVMSGVAPHRPNQRRSKNQYSTEREDHGERRNHGHNSFAFLKAGLGPSAFSAPSSKRWPQKQLQTAADSTVMRVTVTRAVPELRDCTWVRDADSC